ncbi:MAG TPA: organic hydroperoxide resistance protein [Acidimicrobiales bacterium]|nr:organic hydroperoxide resistance protein [Acidimicrobiales bacterium]
MNVIYTAEATAWGGRNGRASTTDGILDVMLDTPKELGGKGEGTNPEQLMAAGYAGCFHSALLLVAKAQKVEMGDSAVTAKVSLGANAEGGFVIEVALHAEIHDVDQATADALVEATETVCPYSNAMRGNVNLQLEVTTGDE